MARVVRALLVLVVSSQGMDVRVPPSISKGPEITVNGAAERHQMFKIDDTVKLPCVATGVPHPEYEWYRDGSLMDLNNHVNIDLDPEQPGTGSIVIKPAYSLDEGYYQCRVENEHGIAVSQIVFLQRARLDPVISENAKEYPVTEGEPLKLPCSTGIGIPIPKYSWSTAETVNAIIQMDIVLNKRVNIDGEGNLYFSYVVPEDAKNGFVYKCKMFSNILDITSGGSYATIQVFNNPAAPNLLPENMYHTPGDVIAIKGKEQRLKCLFQGKPEVTISWGRDTSAGLPPYHEVQSSFTELVINPVALDDEAVYTCTGNNVMGSTRQDITVRVEAEPEFEKASDGPRDMNFTEGDVAEVRCWAFAIPDARVQWFINGQRFEDMNPGNRYKISADGKTLTIEDVCKDCEDGTSDIQNIQCNASNVHGYAYDGGYINVLLHTTIAEDDRPVNTFIKYGGENKTSLDCFATSDDSTPISYKWLHDGKDVDYKDGVIWMAENHSLIIKPKDEGAAREYVGVYTCVASNGYSTAFASADVNLEGYSPEGGPPKRDFLGFIIAAVLVLVLVLVVLVVVVCCVKRRSRDNVLKRFRRKPKKKQSSKDSKVQSNPQRGSYESIPDSWYGRKEHRRRGIELPITPEHKAKQLNEDKRCKVTQPAGDVDYEVTTPAGDAGYEVPRSAGDEVTQSAYDARYEVLRTAGDAENEVSQPADDYDCEVTSPAGDAGYEAPQPAGDAGYEAPQPADDVQYEIPRPTSETGYEVSQSAEKPRSATPDECSMDPGYIIPGYPVEDHGYITPGYEVVSE